MLGDLVTGQYDLSNPNKTATVSFNELGVTEVSELALIFDPSEVNSTGQKIQVDDLILTVNANITSVEIFNSGAFASVTHLQLGNPGLGQGDFIYGLDTNQAAALNSALGSSFGDYRIGLYSYLSYVDDGPDTWLIAKGFGTPPVPEPTTMLLFGTGLADLAGLRRKMKK